MLNIAKFRSDKTRVLFPSISSDAIQCTEKCLKYNRARAPIFTNHEEFSELISWGLSYNIDNSFWLPIRSHLDLQHCSNNDLSCSDSETEGVWKNHYTQERMNLTFAVSGDKLNGGKKENCAVFSPKWGGWNDWPCTISKVSNNQTYTLKRSIEASKEGRAFRFVL